MRLQAVIVALVCLSLTACGKKPTSKPLEPAAFWVWHRSSELTAAEVTQLRDAGTKNLYWQAVECGWRGGAWDAARIAAPMELPAGISITPVFRIKPDPAFLGAPSAVESFADLFRQWANGTKFPELQLDFDCPDRVLESYGKFLRELGEELAPTRLSITALANWPRHPGFQRLAESVGLLVPMFYDLQPDRAERVRDFKFQPMANPNSRELIAAWAKCPVPWLAGLPNFERTSIFHADGKLSGHLRGGSHDELFLQPGLRPRLLGEGVTLYQPSEDFTLDGTRIARGSLVVHRAPNEEILQQLASDAEAAGAHGIVYFALPGPGIQAAFSASHLAGNGAPQLSLKVREDGAVILRNAGPADLPVRPEGWELVLESPAGGGFRSAGPGGFALLESEIPPELSKRVTLKFPRLTTEAEIVSGPLVVAPDGLDWNVPGTGK